MTRLSRRALYWTPRALSIAFILFLSLFALDVFGQGYGFWGTLAAFAIHLIPSFILIAALALAWRWEWVGALLYAAAGAWLMRMTLGSSAPASARTINALVLAGPTFLIAALFLANWLKRAELRMRP